MKSNQAALGLKRLEDYVDEHDDDWLMQERYARLEVKAGFYQRAEKRYLRIIENEPKAYTSKLSVALLRLERDEFASAEKLLVELQDVPQYRSTALYYLGVSAQEQNHLKQAKGYYGLIQSQDYLVDAQLHIAEIDFSTIGLQKTIQNLNAVKASSPEDQIKLYRGKAVFYNLSGEKEKAIEEYSQALAIDQNQVELYLMQAMLFYDLKQFDRYETNLKKALSINPNDVDVLNALGYFYAEQNRELDQATELLDKALSLAPDRYYVLDSRGWLAYQKGQYKEAESYLKRALDIQLDDEVLIHLIHTQWRLNKKTAATRLWKKYHSKFPDNQRLQRILLDLSS
ncbi:MAG: tetratricopeptide repeat protein [Hydrogenovibrio crunogenus]|nr:tetratricopeptide repeat protein [Hydrogenovibrio crunogenus]